MPVNVVQPVRIDWRPDWTSPNPVLWQQVYDERDDLMGVLMGTLTLADTDDGTRVAAHVGDLIEIHLLENPTTGYRWAVEHIGEGVTVEVDEFRLEGTPLLPGAGGVHEWRLKADAAGPQPIRLKLCREWEGESGVIRRFAVDLNVD